ncbi:MAG TPA: 30S ribosomal protein S7 [Verrucomicrobiales bacterium]|nr:30S ribosomal protein S7 [Verrucomicrobiales bacterium]
MSRRRRVHRKPFHVDPRYESALVSRLVNRIMRCGKKALAERIIYAAIERSNEGSDNVDPLEILNRAVENSKPKVEVKSRRVGGATYQVPLEVASERQESLAMRWLIGFARNRKGVPMHVALANEIRDAAKGQGSVVRRRDEMHKMAQANRAFAHFRW